MKPTTVIFTNEHSVSDHRLEEWFQENKDKEVIHFSNQTQMFKCRVEHLKGNIIIDHFNLNGEIVNILDDGNVDYFPDGFFDTSFELAKEISRLIRGRKNA